MTDEQLLIIEARAGVLKTTMPYPGMWNLDSASIDFIRNDVPALVAEVRRLKSGNDMFAAFGRDVMNGIYDAGDWWADDTFNEYLLPIAEQHGLVRRVPYDPAVHGEGIDADEGDEIWWIDKTKWPAGSAEIERLRADIERIGHERDQMVAANVELQERLSKFEDDGK